MFECPTNNKFIVKSGLLISYEGICIYDILYDKPFVHKAENSPTRSLFEKVEELKKALMLSSSRRQDKCYMPFTFGNQILFLHINEDDRDNEAKGKVCLVRDFIYDCYLMESPIAGDLQYDFYKCVRNLNEKMESRKEITQNFLNDLFLYKIEHESSDLSIKAQGQIDDSFTTCLLANLAMNSNLKLLEHPNCTTPREQLLKFPYVLNLEYPTMKLMTRMLCNYMNESALNYVKLYSILTLLEKHINAIKKINFNLRLAFLNDEEVTDLMKLILKVVNSVNEEEGTLMSDIRTLCIVIIFEMLSIACLKPDIVIQFLNDILTDITSHLNENNFIISIKNNLILRHFCDYMAFNYTHFEILLLDKPLGRSFLQLLDKLCNDEGKISSSDDFLTKKMITCFKEFFNQFYIYLSKLLLKTDRDDTLKSSACEYYHSINRIIFHRSRDILRTNPSAIRINNHLTFTLLNFIVLYTNINDLNNIFVMKNWGVLLEIISMISNARISPTDNNENLTRHDIIIDNLLFGENEQEKSFGFDLNEGGNEEKGIQNLQTIYIETMAITPKITRDAIVKIFDYDGAKLIASIYNSDYRKESYSTFHEISNVDMNRGIKISLMPLKSDVKPLFKIRIANYKFYDNPLDNLLKPLVNLFNRMLKFLSFYENEEFRKKIISQNKDELLQLYSTRLFSGGLKSIYFLENSNELNDLQLFEKELKENSDYYYTAVDACQLLMETSHQDDGDHCDYDFKTLISKEKDSLPYSKLFQVFDQIMKLDNKNLHILKGEIPDKLVRAAFFIAIKHERLFEVLNSKVVELFPPEDEGKEKSFDANELLNLVKNDENFNNLFLIWKECSELRKLHRTKKDEMNLKDHTEQEIADYFDVIIDKLGFLFYLNSAEDKTASTVEKKKSAGGKTVTKNPSESLKRMISQQEAMMNSHQEDTVFSRAKEHLTNLTHVIKTEAITVTNMKLGFEYMNLKANFREIALKIIIDVIKTVNDPEIKVNIISNFYHSFILFNSDGNVEGNSLGIPSIYAGLNGASANLGANITNVFHIYLSCLIEEINNNQKANTNFVLATLLNAMIWKVSGRNFSFFVESKFFTTLYMNPLNELVRKANRLLYILPEVNSSTNDLSLRFSHFTEFRPLDLCHISKLLTDMFSIYSNLIVKRVVKESKAKSNKTFSNNLVRAKSSIVSYYNELLNLIFENFEEHLDRIAEIYLMKNIHIDDIDNEIANYNFPTFSNADLDLLNIKYAQIKLYNLLSNFFKVVITQDENIKFIYYKFGLWAKIFILSLFANEKNLKLIFQLMKLFFNNSEGQDLFYFALKVHDKYTEPTGLDKNIKMFDVKNSADTDSVIYFILDFLNKIPRRQELFTSLKYMQKFKKNTGELTTIFDIVIDLNKYLLTLPCFSKYITDYIIEQGSSYFLQTANADLSSLSNVRSVKSNTKLKLGTVKTNVLFDDKDLDILIKSGYLTDTKKSKKAGGDKETDKTRGNTVTGPDLQTIPVSFLIGNSEPKKDTGEITEDVNLTNVIIMKEPATRENVKMNQPNYIMSADNDIIAVDSEFSAVYNESMIGIVLAYLQENLITKTEYSPNMLINYIRMIKYITKILRYDQNEDHHKQIVEFLNKNSQFIQRLSGLKNDYDFPFSLMSTENLENWFASVVNCYNPVIEVNKIEQISFEEKIRKKKDEDNVVVLSTIGKFRKNPNKIILCNDDIHSSKLSIPYLDSLLLYSSKNSDKYLKKLEQDVIFEVTVLEKERVMTTQSYGKVLSNYIILLSDKFVEEMGIEDDSIASTEANVKENQESKKEEDEPKKKIKSNWNKFSNFVSTNYDLETCIFLINNKYFNKIKKNMITVGYDPEFFDSSSIVPNPAENKNITNESLYQMIAKKTNEIQMENSYDYLKTLLPKKKKENLGSQPFDEKKIFEMLSMQFDLEDILGKKSKDSEKDEMKNSDMLKDFKNAITIKDRVLKEKKLFKQVFTTFPSKESNKGDVDVINGIGLFLLKQYIRFMHMISFNKNLVDMLDIPTELTAIKLLFYQKFYNRAYFNMKEDIDVVHSVLKKVLEKVDDVIKDDALGEKIIKQIIGEEIFDYDMNPQNEKTVAVNTQDQLLTQVFTFLFDIRDNLISPGIDTVILKLIQELFENSITLIKKTKLEALLTFYSIVQLIFKRLKRDSLSIQILKFLNDSVTLNSIFKYVVESFNSKKEKTEFYVYSLEFVAMIVNIITKKGILEDNTNTNTHTISDELKLFKNQEIISMNKNIDLLDKKFSSANAKECLIDKMDIVTEYRTVKMQLPVKNEIYALSFNSDISTRLDILPDSTENLTEANIYCVQEVKSDQSLLNPQIISCKSSTSNEISVPGNKILLTSDQSSSFQTQLVTNKKPDGGEKVFNLMKIPPKITEIKKMITAYASTIIWCDSNKLYYKGEFNGKSSQNEFTSHEDLDKIANSEKIVTLTNNIILTNKYIYVVGSTDFNGESVSRDIKRVAIPAGKNMVNAKFRDGNMVCWTSDGAVYAMGYNDYNQISRDTERNYSTLTLMNIPSNLKAIDVEVKYSCFVFLMRDTLLDANVVYASGQNKYDGHHLLPATESSKYFTSIEKLKDKNIVQIGVTYMSFFALSQDKKIYYCGRAEDGRSGEVNEPKELEFFTSRNLNVLSMSSNYLFSVFKVLNNAEEKTQFYVIGYINNLFPASTLHTKNQNSVEHTEPALLEIFKEKEKSDEDKDKDKDKTKEKDQDESNKTKKLSDLNEELCDLVSVEAYNDQLFIVLKYFSPAFSSISFEQKKDTTPKSFVMINNPDKSEDKKFHYYILDCVETEKYFIFTIKLSDLASIKSLFENSLKENAIDIDNEIASYNPLDVICKVIDLSVSFSNTNISLMERLSQFVYALTSTDQLVLEKTAGAKMATSQDPTKRVLIKTSLEGKYLPLRVIRTFNQQGKELYKDAYIQSENEVVKCLKESEERYIEEYLKAKKIYMKIILQGAKENKSKIAFEQYLIDKYEKYDQFILMNSKNHYQIIKEMAKIIMNSAKDLIQKVGVKYNTFVSKLIVSNIKYLDYSVREEYFNKGLGVIKRTSAGYNINICRAKSLRLRNRNLVDRTGEFSIFSQLYRELRRYDGSAFAFGRNGRLFYVNLLGEGAIDAGGPYRETLTNAFEDLLSKYMELFIPTPNHSTTTGIDRDKWTINPSANNELSLSLFKFLGKLLGFIILSETFVPLSLPSFIWKQILNVPLDVNDIENIDVQAFNSLIKVLSSPEKYSQELEDLFDVIDMTCVYSNGTVVELMPNGKNIKLNRDNYKNFFDLYLHARYSECREQIKSIQSGLFEVIPESALRFLNWDDIEVRVCGVPDFDMELFKKNTCYHGYRETDKTVKFFWEFLEKCTLEEKYQYLKFVWGRNRLPKDSSGFFQLHTIGK